MREGSQLARFPGSAILALVSAAGLVATGALGLFAALDQAERSARDEAAALRSALHDPGLLDAFPPERRFELRGGALVVDVPWRESPPAEDPLAGLPRDVRDALEHAWSLEFRSGKREAARDELGELLDRDPSPRARATVRFELGARDLRPRTAGSADPGEVDPEAGAGALPRSGVTGVLLLRARLAMPLPRGAPRTSPRFPPTEPAPFSSACASSIRISTSGSSTMPSVTRSDAAALCAPRHRTDRSSRARPVRSCSSPPNLPWCTSRALPARALAWWRRSPMLLERLGAEAARLGLIVENVLDLGRLERGERSYNRRPHRLGDLLRESSAGIEPLARRDGLELRVDGACDALVRADRAAVVQAIRNLLENARRYAASGGSVELGAEQRDGVCLVTVRDHGPGLAGDKRERVFEKFRRGTAASRSGNPGVGLGLYLARLIFRDHGGDLVARDCASGACFEATLPVEVEADGRPCVGPREPANHRGGAP